DADAARKGEPQRSPAQSEEASGDGGEAQGGSNDESEKTPTNPIEMALHRPYALPLRMPPTQLQTRKLKSEDAPHSPTHEASQDTKRAKSVDTSANNMGSPILRRSSKISNKASADPKENRMPSIVPLEQTEHEWLVKCASGHWSQVYGLLLRDGQLAEKKDFMSGFTALHWAAKCGNSDMLVKIIDLSNGAARSEYIMAMLVGEYGADHRVRDNCGRRAYHYLHKGISESIKEMLGEPRDTEEPKVVQHEKEEQDVFPDLPKGLGVWRRSFASSV
uniref:Sosondowah ankyrin repeat domain family member Aa n=1 Tax=Neogobius melanostomus TaxID=47308 RepID=A0A8C6SB27_9GOBI